MYLGFNQVSGDCVEVRFRAILGFDGILVFKSDFECTEENNCSFESKVLKQLTFKNRVFSYQDAQASINVINEKFEDKIRFKYIVNKKKEDDFSIVGLSDSSLYNNYLFKQDQRQGFRVIYRLDSFGNFKFRFGMYSRDKFKFETREAMTVQYQLDDQVQDHNLVGCLSNDIDMLQEFNFLAVSQMEFKNWAMLFIKILEKYIPDLKNVEISSPQEAEGFLRQVKGEKEDQMMEELQNFKMKIKIQKDSENILGEMVILGSELMNVKTNQFKIKPIDFSDYDYLSGTSKCDFFFGSAMLQKYNFKFYYVEYDLGYDFLFSYDLETKDYVIDEDGHKIQKESKWKWLKIIIVVLVMGLIGYYFWSSNR